MYLGLALALLIGAGAYSVDAGPASNQEQFRLAMIDSDGTVFRSVMIDDADGAATGVASTAVTGEMVCVAGAADQFAANLTLSGTLTGTNPTLTTVLQHSIDGGDTWSTAHSFTVINATVTPAAQLVSLADVPASTAVTFGDCWRYQYTFGGSGTLSGTINLSFMAK